MKKFCRALSAGLGLVLSPAVSLFAQGDQLDLQDIQALRDWINTKRQVTVKEIGGNLSLSGEVRFEFQASNEVKKGIRQRGPNGSAATSIPSRAFDIEVNIMLDYRADRTWSAIKIEFDNDAGVFTATNDRIRMEKAYFGVRVYDGDLYIMDFEIGRRPLFTAFDSKVQFVAQSDGVFWKNDWSFAEYGDAYIHLLGMITNDRRNQYTFIGELGWLGIMGTGLYMKYSLADWDTIGGKEYDFIVNQWLIGYKWIPEWFGKIVMPYAAFLWNPAAAQSAYTAGKKANLGGYIGFTMGELRKQGDWAFDANYQVMQAQAAPGYDSNGIGVGNAAGVGLYTTKTNEQGAPLANPKDACGKNNFRGFMLTLDYLLTSNLNVQQQWIQACTLDKEIGPWRRFKQYEIEFIYGF